MDIQRKIQLFQLVKENLINGNPKNQYGICQAINNVAYSKEVTINDDEYFFLKFHLDVNKPTRQNEYAEFMHPKYWLDGAYWWDTIDDYPETKQIRIDYLTKLISNIK